MREFIRGCARKKKNNSVTRMINRFAVCQKYDTRAKTLSYFIIKSY